MRYDGTKYKGTEVRGYKGTRSTTLLSQDLIRLPSRKVSNQRPNLAHPHSMPLHAFLIFLVPPGHNTTERCKLACEKCMLHGYYDTKDDIPSLETHTSARVDDWAEMTVFSV